MDWTANVTAPYTGDYFFEELHGLADGAGVDYQDVLRIHMIGELTQVRKVAYFVTKPPLLIHTRPFPRPG